MHPTKIITVITALALTTACANPSAQHSGQAAGHSAQAGAHGSVAVVTGVAEVSAVPLIVAGTMLTVSGAALQGVAAGADCLTFDIPCVAPNGPPALN